MLHHISLKVVNKLMSENIISRENKEFYYYELEVMMERGITFMGILFLAVIFGELFSTLLFLFIFLSLRKRTGGFHAATYFRCFVGSLILYSICIFGFMPFLTGHIGIMTICLAISYLVIRRLAPVNHPNMEWNSEELTACKLITMRLLHVQLLGIAAAYILGMHPRFIAAAGLGIITCAVLITAAKLTKQEVKEE